MTLDGLDRRLRQVLTDSLLAESRRPMLPEERPTTEVDLVTLAERLVAGDTEAFERAQAEGLVRLTGHTYGGRPELDVLCPAWEKVVHHYADRWVYDEVTGGRRERRHADLLDRWPVVG